MTGKRLRWGNELIILGFFLVLYVLIFRGDYLSMDEMGRYGLTKTLFLEHDLSITKADGTSFYIPWPLLQSVAAVPLFALGWFLSGSSDPVEREALARFLVTFFCPIVSALACVVFYRLCRQFTDRARTGLLMTLAFGLCTISLPYSRTFFSEPFTGLLLMGGILLAITSTREKPARGILSGLLLALTVANNYVALPVFGLVFIFFACQDDGFKGALKTDTLKDARLWGLIFFGMAALGQSLWYNHVRVGMWFRSPYYYLELPANAIYPANPPLFSYPILAGVYGFLFSPMRSLFLYSPALIGALIMWPRFIRDHGRKAILLLAIPVYYMLVYAKTQGWFSGYSWGPRYMVPVTGFFLLPFIYLISDYARLRKIWKLSVAAMLIVGFYIQLLPTILNPFKSHIKVLEDFGGLPNELLILHLPQACSVVVQTQLLKAISGPADTDLYFLKHLDSGMHLIVMVLLVLILVVMTTLLITRIGRGNFTQ
jgi:hypothetical protein